MAAADPIFNSFDAGHKIPEPRWHLSRCDDGQLHWARLSCEEDATTSSTTSTNTPNTSSTDHQVRRVRFRCKVDVREFERAEYEIQKMTQWDDEGSYDENAHPLIMGVTCVACLLITVLLPYVVIG